MAFSHLVSLEGSAVPDSVVELAADVIGVYQTSVYGSHGGQMVPRRDYRAVSSCSALAHELQRVPQRVVKGRGLDGLQFVLARS